MEATRFFISRRDKGIDRCIRATTSAEPCTSTGFQLEIKEHPTTGDSASPFWKMMRCYKDGLGVRRRSRGKNKKQRDDCVSFHLYKTRHQGQLSEPAEGCRLRWGRGRPGAAPAGGWGRGVGHGEASDLVSQVWDGACRDACTDDSCTSLHARYTS